MVYSVKSISLSVSFVNVVVDRGFIKVALEKFTTNIKHKIICLSFKSRLSVERLVGVKNQFSFAYFSLDLLPL